MFKKEPVENVSYLPENEAKPLRKGLYWFGLAGRSLMVYGGCLAVILGGSLLFVYVRSQGFSELSQTLIYEPIITGAVNGLKAFVCGLFVVLLRDALMVQDMMTTEMETVCETYEKNQCPAYFSGSPDFLRIANLPGGYERPECRNCSAKTGLGALSGF